MSVVYFPSNDNVDLDSANTWSDCVSFCTFNTFNKRSQITLWIWNSITLSFLLAAWQRKYPFNVPECSKDKSTRLEGSSINISHYTSFCLPDKEKFEQKRLWNKGQHSEVKSIFQFKSTSERDLQNTSTYQDVWLFYTRLTQGMSERRKVYELLAICCKVFHR